MAAAVDCLSSTTGVLETLDVLDLQTSIFVASVTVLKMNGDSWVVSNSYEFVGSL